MSLAEYKDLCIDAVDPGALGQFWSAALGLDLNRQDDGDVCLTGEGPAHTVWVNAVPESKTTKHRVHLDVFGVSVEELLAIGASEIDSDSFGWVVMADPEGGEFCLFLRDEPPSYRLYEVAIDCTDHVALSSWWAACLGGQSTADEGGFSSVSEIPGAPFESLSFGPVTERKQIKNRIHLDVFASDVDALIESGATLLSARDGDVRWSVLADPEGNEFCVFHAD